jgi:hypothetical protein
MFSHIYQQALATPESQWADTGTTYSGDTIQSVDGVVNANGGGANAVAIAFPATAGGLQSVGLLASVPCVVTLTGATVIDGVSTSTVTLVAGVIRLITAITGAVTAVSVGANTDSSGPAGTIKISALFNS